MKPYKIFGEEYIDEKAKGQFYDAMKLDCVVQGALMPDAHFGYALPIGGVVATRDMLFPSWVGYDIGCGMCAIPTSYNAAVLEERKEEIFEDSYNWVKVGFHHNRKPQTWREFADYPTTRFFKNMFWEKGGLKQLGTLGGGNHFIEIGYDNDGQAWIIVHSGSRNVGHSTAQYYMKEACFLETGRRKAAEGHFGFKMDTDLANAYYMDMRVCEDFALENRRQILERMGKMFRSLNIEGELDWDNLINRNHNHVEFRPDMVIHRKGATHADKDMLGVIPGNMRDGSFIVRGLGNDNSLCSSSHGAGRVLGRKKAKEQLDLNQFKDEMRHISANVQQSTIDESPMAYKDVFTVMEYQKDLVDIVAHIKPIINVKG